MMRRVAVTMAAVCSAVLLLASPAIAAERGQPNQFGSLTIAAAPHHSGLATAGSSRADLSYTFSKEATQRIYSIFKSGGAAAATAYCVYIVPTPLKPSCATIIVILYELTGAPLAKNTCYQIYARWGWPPVGGRIVRC